MAQKVLSFHNTCLDEHDVSLLDNGQWLNDKLIGFAFEYFEYELYVDISSRVVFVSPEVTQFIKMIESKEEVAMFLSSLSLKTCEYIFFAVNNCESSMATGGTHWSLLVYCRKLSTFDHFDSCNGMNKTSASQLCRHVAPHITEDPIKLNDVRCVQQSNGYDCGMYVIIHAESICASIEKKSILFQDYVQSNISDERRKWKRIVNELSDRK